MCDSDPRHTIGKQIVRSRVGEEEYQKRLERYNKDCNICGNDAKCLSQTLTNLTRGVETYPWLNYDWDYSNYVDNNYSAKATGSTPAKGNVINNIGAGLKIMRGFITEPNPGKDSIAGGKNIGDRTSDFPVFGCEGNRRESCQKLWQVKQNGQLGKPYDDPFFNNHPTTGEASSSYYFKVGVCNRKDIASKEDCDKKGYNWNGSNCIQDRYAYMNNKGGMNLLGVDVKGYLPSLGTDMISFAPNYIINAYRGKSSKYMKIQDCPETFQNPTDYQNLWIGLFVSTIMLTILYKLKKS
jgi:hypothetical protein